MIRLEQIHKTYNNGSPLHVLKGIDLQVARGELVSIMGASGSGKSTLLNILGILDNYDSGSYYLAGRPIRGLNEKQAAEARNCMIGYIFQSFNLISYKNAVENVALPLYYQGVSRRKRNALALEYLDLLGLKEWASHMPNEMSGGQQAADHSGRRADGRSGQRHLAGSDEPAAPRQPRNGHDHHLRHPRTVDRRPDRQDHPPARRGHRLDRPDRTRTMNTPFPPRFAHPASRL